MNVADHLARVTAVQPKLSAAEQAEHDRIWKRLHRAEGDLRRAKERGDDKKLAAAERAVARAKDAREAFVAPLVEHLTAPARIVATFEAHWSGPSGAGIHRQECEMVLDHKDISGPQYRTIRVIQDVGAPPTNARRAPDAMGVAWFAIADQIKTGKIAVLGEEAS